VFVSQIIDDVEKLIGPVLKEHNIELVDLTYQKSPSGWTLSAYLDKDGGITLADCETWNHRLGDLLDQSNIMSHAYSLEVSSPGLDRPIKRVADYERFKGERVQVKLFAPLDGQKNFHGILLGTDGVGIKVKVDGDRVVEIPLAQVAKTKLDPEIKF
jgi:ribosome maturation factor RimP